LRRVELGEADERCRAWRRGEARARTAARIGVVPEVPDQRRTLTGEPEIVLARARDDELPRLVVERLELVVLRRAAEQLHRQHRDRGDDAAGAGPGAAPRRLPAEREARRDPDLLAEADLGDVAVDRARVEPVPLDEILERARGAQRPLEHVALRARRDVVDPARLALELGDPGAVDREIELAELTRLDAHRLDSGGRAEAIVVRVDAVVALEDGPDPPDPRAPQPRRHVAGTERRRHRVERGRIVDEADDELEGPAR